MKKRFILAALLSLVGMTSTYNATASNNSSWIPPYNGAATYHSVTYQDLSTLKWNYSVLQAYAGNGMFLCKGTSDPHCAGQNNFTYSSILKACEAASDTDCIEAIDSTDSQGNVSQGKFERYTVPNHFDSYPADKVRGIPEGSVPSIWNLPGAQHSTGVQYAIVAGLSGDVSGTTNRNNVLAVSLFPVDLRTFVGQPSTMWDPTLNYDYCQELEQAPGKENIGCGHVMGPDCLLPINVPQQCYEQDSFPSDTRFTVKLRLSKEPTAWLHGRLVDPNIAITPINSGGVELSVNAGSTGVPMVYQGGYWADLPQSLKDFWVRCMNDGNNCGMVRSASTDHDYWAKSLTLEGNGSFNLDGSIISFGSIAMAGMKAIAPLVGDKAAAQTSSWSYRTLSTGEMQGADACFTKSSGVKGLVTTNSTTYSAGPPAFDKSTGILNYQVASPHFNPDGSVFKGNYNLVIKSEVARCLYGFSKAPVNATISITSADGTPQLATTVVGEKDGWIYLKASNFEFSAPTVQVKFTQEASTPAPAPAPATKSNAPASKPAALTCVKGKISKVVKGTACPSGYKRK